MLWRIILTILDLEMVSTLKEGLCDRNLREHNANEKKSIVWLHYTKNDSIQVISCHILLVL